jgi:predicted component of type VI protein secretion system
MAKLIVESNSSSIEEFSLDKECVTIGRKPDNDIELNNLSVSGHHAQIITILNESFLEDLNSTNGTFVNAKLIRKFALRNGDVIRIGEHQLKYVNELAADNPTNDFEKTMILGSTADSVGVNGVVPPSDEATEFAPPLPDSGVLSDQTVPPRQAKLQILSGANAGKELKLIKNLTTLGKPGVAMTAITKRRQGYFIIHIEGGKTTPTTRVNGDPISVHARELKDHDVLDVAGIKMEFYLI